MLKITSILSSLLMAITVVILTLAFCTYSFAAKKVATPKEIEKEFYSETIISENINNGVKVSIVKSDKYGNNQDEFTSVDINVENLNMYADLDFTVEALTHDEFKVLDGKSQSGIVTSSDNTNFSFDYAFKNPTKKYDRKNDNTKYKKSFYIHASESDIVTTSSDAYEKLRRERELFENTDDISDINDTKEPSFMLFIIAVIIIAFIFLIFIIYMIRRYIKSNNDEFYSFFLILTIVASILLSFVFNIDKAYAYNQQTFNYDTEYSNTYSVTVYHQGRAYIFRYRVNYKFVGDMPTFDKELDTDNDGLTDEKEVYFMTDLNNPDTDGDMISDYDEIYIIDTDPLVVDTNKNGVNDGDEDYDKDGLTNIEEYTYNTNLSELDTDLDGLTDYDEIKVYKTDPTVKDTDNDGISDYEEVEVAKKLGISDISSVDLTVKLEQELSRSNMESSLYKENVVKISLEGTVPGLIDSHVKLTKSNNASFDNNETIIGLPINIESDYKSEKMTIKFDCKQYKERINGLTVATYKNGKIELLDTKIDGTTVSADVTSGDVMLIDGLRLVDLIYTYKKDNYK